MMDMQGSFHVGGMLFMLLMALVIVVPMWRIVTKAGFHGAWSLLSLVPMLNVILLWVFAFSTWPKPREPVQTSRDRL